MAALVIWHRLVPHLYSSSTASSGSSPSAVALAYSSAFSLLGAP